MDIAIDVVEFHASVGGDPVSLMKFFRESAPAVGGMRLQCKRQQRANGTQRGSQPSGGLTITFHLYVSLQGVRRSYSQFVRRSPRICFAFLKKHCKTRSIAPIARTGAWL